MDLVDKVVKFALFFRIRNNEELKNFDGRDKGSREIRAGPRNSDRESRRADFK